MTEERTPVGRVYIDLLHKWKEAVVAQDDHRAVSLFALLHLEGEYPVEMQDEPGYEAVFSPTAYTICRYVFAESDQGVVFVPRKAA